MARPTDILTVDHWEDTPLVIMARVRDATATNITQAGIDSIAIYVFDGSGTQVSTTIAPTVASTVFDTLQTDARWTKDSTGYNFRYTIAAAYFPTGDVNYRVEVIFTPATGEPFPLVVVAKAKRLLSS